ncbi:MFS general substrate transporter [Serendipita vermifera]|nr:MFS general substrate transporter [Serendipita vermifera]
MTFPPINADENAQVPWPEPTSPVEVRDPLPTRQPGELERQNTVASNIRIGERHMTWKDFINISVSMAGAQIAWTLELGYGTPFLRGLGLPEHLTSLVWLAGPISGLVAQPLIGAISDSSSSAYRRRLWIWIATGALIFATLTLAYVEPIASFLVDMFSHMEDWNPARQEKVKNLAIGLAILCFYILDFALNALQASLRNLLLDLTPAEQLATGNAWHGRMTHAGNIIGYTLGAQDLDKWPFLKIFGHGQFRKICILTMVILSVTVSITCITQHETARPQGLNGRGRFRDVINNITKAILQLPKPIKRVCVVQIFAFVGWFPFLFYATVWVGEVMAREIDADPSVADATRAGELALLLSSIVSVVVGTVLPYIAQRDTRLLSKGDEDEDEDEEISRIRALVRSWKAEAARMGRPLHLPAMPFMLRNIWTGGLLLFGVLMMSTFFVNTVWQATLVISLVGISWAIACWVPFALIMEYLKEVDAAAAAPPVHPQQQQSFATRRGTHGRVASSPAIWRGMQNPRLNERQPLLRRQSLRLDYEAETGEIPTPPAGGTILGIHNLAIVFPQFLIALVATAIFRIVDSKSDSNPNDVYYGKNGVAWVLRFGGLSALIGAAFSRAVAPTRTEKEMRRRLAEMQESNEE